MIDVDSRIQVFQSQTNPSQREESGYCFSVFILITASLSSKNDKRCLLAGDVFTLLSAMSDFVILGFVIAHGISLRWRLQHINYRVSHIASVLLCETAVSFLQEQPIGTYVWLPKMHNTPPDADLESLRSLAQSAALVETQSAF